MRTLTRLFLCFVISFTLTEAPVVYANSGMISTHNAVQSITRDQNRAMNEKKVTDFLTRKDVQNQIVKLGVKPEEASRRVAALSDDELSKLSSEIDHSTSGGLVIEVLTIVVLVLLVLFLVKRV